MANYAFAFFFTIAFYFIFHSLILSGDIEVNPGPIYRDCPECNQKVHIKQKNCTCGHIFDKKSRSFSKPYIPIDSLELSTECATGATQESICPVIPGSPVDKTSTSVDSEISTGLLTAPVSCSVPVRHSLDVSHGFIVSDESLEEHQSHTQIQPLSQPLKRSSKWSKHSAKVNAKRQLKYNLDPMGKRRSSLQYYYSQPDVRKKRC